MRALPILLFVPLLPPLSAADFSFDHAQAFLKQHCELCHGGNARVGGFSLSQVAQPDSFSTGANTWNRVILRIRNGEMPPRSRPAPARDTIDAFVAYAEPALRTAACSNGLTPGRYPLRRLSRDEYAATVRDLLNIQINAGHSLPPDGAGGEGFDNAAETLTLSPLHVEKYFEAAKEGLEYGARDPKSRKFFLIAEPNPETTPEQAARKVLDAFVPRAFRRPARPGEVDRYMLLFAAQRKKGENYERSILFALRGVMVSPHFLFRIPEPNPDPGPRLVDDYSMASRLSYFLWGSMPDAALFDLAANGKLQDPAVLSEQIARMLKDQKAREFAERFVEQWLNTRELGRDIKPDEKLFPQYWDAEIQSAIKYEPILFFQEILAQNLPLTNLIDSNFSFMTNKLARFYNLTSKDMTQQPKRAALPEDSHRGGILPMAAVLAVSSYPTRTSPVLRGKWILETLLGAPPPPPPPDVPDLKEDHAGAPPRTLRERLEEHRRNPVCASCHARIDPLGFPLESFDVLGRWRTEDNGKPLDTRGELPDGTQIADVAELKKVLMQRKSAFFRHVTSKLLGYALGRGLTPADACTVDRIAGKLEAEEYKSQTLIREIVLSVPFRYQTGTIAGKPVEEGNR